MKTLKYTVILFIITLSSCTQGQIGNILTKAEYINIKINGINWTQITDTKGNISKMKVLFGDNMTIKTGTEPGNMISFWNDNLGFYLHFEQNGPDYALNSFIISNKNSNFTILGKTVTIGSDISELGDVKIDEDSEISFGTNYTSSVLIIKFDPSTRKITEIEFVTFT